MLKVDFPPAEPFPLTTTRGRCVLTILRHPWDAKELILWPAVWGPLSYYVRHFEEITDENSYACIDADFKNSFDRIHFRGNPASHLRPTC